jgi:translation elongation factor EF-1alpha
MDRKEWMKLAGKNQKDRLIIAVDKMDWLNTISKSF